MDVAKVSGNEAPTADELTAAVDVLQRVFDEVGSRRIWTKYKRLRGKKKARTAWNKAVRKRPGAFAHWAWVTHAPTVW